MRVAIVGLGIMGSAMASRLIDLGHEVTVNNRTRDKAAAAVERGAVWADSPAEAASVADIVLSFVTDAKALKLVAFEPGGIRDGLGPEAVHCDMSTISPVDALEIERRYVVDGLAYVQAPVLGSWRQILEGSLLIFGGGATDSLDRCAPVWESCAKKIWRFDTVEQSAAAKLSCNILIGQMIVGLGQTLAMADAGGVDAHTMLDIIASSNLASPMYASKGKTIAEGNFKPNFIVRNMLKDLRLASDYAIDKTLSLPSNAANRELFIRAIADGFGDEDYSAVVKTMMQPSE